MGPEDHGILLIACVKKQQQARQHPTDPYSTQMLAIQLRTQTLLDRRDMLLHFALEVDAAVATDVLDDLQRLELDRVVLVFHARDQEIEHFRARVERVLRHARDLAVEVPGRRGVLLARGSRQQRLVHRR